MLATCAMSGTGLGTAAFWARTPHWPLPFLLIAALGAFAVATVFALIASVFAAVTVILVSRRSAASASRLQLAATGAAAGAIAGALHPIVLVVAIVRVLSPSDQFSSVWWLSALVAASGALAGALIVPRYVPELRARVCTQSSLPEDSCRRRW